MGLILFIIAVVLVIVGAYYLIKGAVALGIVLIVVGVLLGIFSSGGLGDDDIDDGRGAVAGRPFYSRL
jgi:C4-dicarboxylate transporter